MHREAITAYYQILKEKKKGKIWTYDSVYAIGINYADTALNLVSEAGKYLPYKASGMAYIRFAREEKELFKLL